MWTAPGAESVCLSVWSRGRAGQELSTDAVRPVCSWGAGQAPWAVEHRCGEMPPGFLAAPSRPASARESWLPSHFQGHPLCPLGCSLFPLR